MDKKRVDRLQNLSIAVLLLSALFLLYQTQRQSQSGNGGLGNWFSAAVTEDSPAEELSSLPMPVQLAITGPYGRFGDLSILTTEEEFSQPGELLREALGSAGEPQPCQEEDFRAALAGESVYYDFQTSLPLSVIAGLAGGEAPGEFSARRLLLVSEEDASSLYFTNGSTYYRCAAKTAAADLRELINSYQLSGAAFAYELEQDDIAPYSLFLTGETASYPVLDAKNPAGDEAGLLSALGFNPGTKDRYTESTGTLVVREGDRTLRISPDGTAVYDSGSTTDLQVAAGSDTPTLEEAVMGSYRFFSQLLPDNGADLCLQSVARQDGDWLLTFDYQYDGVIIRRSDGAAAATVRLKGRSISWFSLYLRLYSAGEEDSHLLPLAQMLAIGQRYTGKELNVRYIDAGGSPVPASWLAETGFF